MQNRDRLSALACQLHLVRDTDWREQGLIKLPFLSVDDKSRFRDKE